jgi:hypothetical protein
VRGQAVNSQNDWVVLSNAPGSRLDASLGATSLEHSYAGTAWKSSPPGGPFGRDITFRAFFDLSESVGIPILSRV